MTNLHEAKHAMGERLDEEAAPVVKMIRQHAEAGVANIKAENDRLRELIEAREARCESCNVPFDKHLGIVGTCLALRTLREENEQLRNRLQAESGFLDYTLNMLDRFYCDNGPEDHSDDVCTKEIHELAEKIQGQRTGIHPRTGLPVACEI